MNNERYNQIIDEAYKNYWSNAKHNNSDCLIKQEEGSLLVEMRFYYKQEFINKCKTNTEFSERWGLKIEERELSDDARNIFFLAKMNPLKQITVTYNGEKIEVYE